MKFSGNSSRKLHRFDAKIGTTYHHHLVPIDLPEISRNPAGNQTHLLLTLFIRTTALELSMNDDSIPPAAGPGRIPPLLRLPAVLEATGLGRSTVYRVIAEHAFPAPVKIAKRAVAWRDDDVRRWTSGRPSTSDSNGSAARRR